jgi:hypothetical protein
MPEVISYDCIMSLPLKKANNLQVFETKIGEKYLELFAGPSGRAANPTGGLFVYYECCVLSGRGLCDKLITRPEESYRLLCVIVCDLENLKNGHDPLWVRAPQQKINK